MSRWAHPQKTNVRDLAMRMRVEPAHGPTGSMASGTGRKHRVLPFLLRARLVSCVTGVLKLDLT